MPTSGQLASDHPDLHLLVPEPRVVNPNRPFTFLSIIYQSKFGSVTSRPFPLILCAEPGNLPSEYLTFFKRLEVSFALLRFMRHSRMS